jgi:dual specificity phosphatase 3
MTARPELRHANAQFVADRLLVGGDLDLFDSDTAVRQRAELVAAGVTHVVDCRIEWDDAQAWRGTGVHYVRAPIDDAGQRVPAAWFEAEVGRVIAWFEEPDAVVLTHCHMGVNRGPSLGFAVLLGLGLEPVEALRAIQAARPIAYAYYAEDALEWWIERHGLAEAEAAAHREALATYREQQRLDVVHVIADIRSAERDAGPASWDA